MVTDRPSLRAPDLDAFWARVRERVERTDGDVAGRLPVPVLTTSARLTLETLLDRRLGKTINLRDLEDALRRLDVGPTLIEALAALGHAPSDTAARRRAEGRVSRDARAAARDEAAQWTETWRDEWITTVIRTGALRGLDEQAATLFVRDVRRVIDRLEREPAHALGAALSRVELAADLFGDSHALDNGTRLEAAVSRALARRHETSPRREVWELAGVHLDLTSAPVLVWGLPLDASSGLGRLVTEANGLGVPLHLSQFALRRHPLAIAAGTEVFVVENPRLVEAAAQRKVDRAFVATNGNPSTAVRVLLDQLVACGARVRCHTDFDAAGLAICARLYAIGLEPWAMTAADYLAAVARAEVAPVTLPLDAASSPATPWDPALQAAFERERKIVHEERLIEELLG